MQVNFSLKLLPSEAADGLLIREYLAGAAGKKTNEVSGYHILKRSIDARAKTTWINLTCKAFINEPFVERTIQSFDFRDASSFQRRR
jgi:hypothetical protein